MASTNPRRRKGLMGAKQVFKPRPAASQQTAGQREEEDDYVFNPADFETEEEALESATKFTDGEAFEPERENSRRPFGKAPRSKREEFSGRDSFRGERRSFGDGERRGGFRGGERRSFGDGERRGGFRGGERRSFGDGERRGGGFRNERKGGFGGGPRKSFRTFNKRRPDNR